MGLSPQDLPGPLNSAGWWKGSRVGGGEPSYPEADLPVGAHLQIEAVGAVPVAVDNVHFTVPVEVGQGDTPPVLVGIVHTWGESREPSGQRPLQDP